MHHAGGDREGAECLAAPGDRQAVHAQGDLFGISGQGGLATRDPGAALLQLRHRLGVELLSRFKRCGVRCLCRSRGQVQAETTFLRNAFLAAHQPLGLQTKGQWPLVREAKVRPHRDRHCQQQAAFIAIVGQGADGDFFGQRPGDLTRLQPRRQLPLDPCGQARVARVLPIGVPVRLVLDLQAQPKSLPGANALRGVHQQFGPHLFGVDHLAGTAEQGGSAQGAGRCPLGRKQWAGLCLAEQRRQQESAQAQPQAEAQHPALNSGPATREHGNFHAYPY